MSFKDIWRRIKPSEQHPLFARKIAFSYKDTEILRGLNLTVKSSQIIAVVGQSGSGKTTFLNIVSGVLTGKHTGKLSILGHNKSLAKDDIGYVPQDISLVPDMDLKENFQFFGSLNGLKNNVSVSVGKALMKTLQLDVPLNRLPTELSGGQKVRMNIIVSLLHNPKVIILDEPFVGLDYFNRKLLWHFLEHQKNRHKTIIITTHMLAEAEHHASRLILLHEGKIFARGKMEDIMRKLKTRYIVEIKFSYISGRSHKAIEKYCESHDVSIIDFFNNYMMISVNSEGQKNYFFRHLDKLKLDFKEVGFREPNLDELFLKVRTG